MKTLILILVVLNFASFLWSVVGVFQLRDDRSEFLFWFLSLTSLVLWVVAVRNISLGADRTLLTWGLLAAVQIFCLMAFWYHTRIAKEYRLSAVFSRDLPERLIQKGFYKRVRHPFYMIYLICYLSIGLAYPDLLFWILSLALVLVYYKAASLEEEKFMKSQLAGEYRQYRRHAFMFFPRLY